MDLVNMDINQQQQQSLDHQNHGRINFLDQYQVSIDMRSIQQIISENATRAPQVKTQNMYFHLKSFKLLPLFL